MNDMNVSERLLIAGKLLGKTLAGYRDDDLRSAARGAVDLGQLMFDANDEIERLRGDKWRLLAEVDRLQDHMRALADTSVDRDTAGIFKGMWQGSEKECDELRADNERLRALLADKQYIQALADYNKGHLSHAGWLEARARRALEPKP